MRKPIEYTPGSGINLSDIEVRSPEQEYLDEEYECLADRYLSLGWSQMRTEEVIAGCYENMERAVLVSPDALRVISVDQQQFVSGILDRLSLDLPDYARYLYGDLQGGIPRSGEFDKLVFINGHSEYRLGQVLIWNRICSVFLNARSGHSRAAHDFFARGIKTELAYGLLMQDDKLPPVLQDQLTDIELHRLRTRVRADQKSVEQFFGENDFARNVHRHARRDALAQGSAPEFAWRWADTKSREGLEGLREAQRRRKERVAADTAGFVATFPELGRFVDQYLVRPDGYVPKVE